MAVIDSTTLGQLSGSRRFKNGLATGLVYSAFGLALIPLVWLSWTVVSKGIDRFFVDGRGDCQFRRVDHGKRQLQRALRTLVRGKPLRRAHDDIGAEFLVGQRIEQYQPVQQHGALGAVAGAPGQFIFRDRA